MTVLTNALIGKLNASDDLAYHLGWTYGDFLEDIPRRIGTNEALDAAVASLVTAHSYFGSRRSMNNITLPDAKTLQKYSHALTALRIYLDNPARARETETLCAVMLLLICQSLLGADDGRWDSTVHGEGAARILKARAFFRTKDPFEHKLILTLRGPVLFESLINPRIYFNSEESAILTPNGLDEAIPGAQMMRCLAYVPDLMYRGRIALREQEQEHILHVLIETRRHYAILQAVSRRLHSYISAIEQPPKGISQSASSHDKARASCQRSYGLSISICIIFNRILKALDMNNTELDVEAKHFCDSILVLANQATIYRPLGASYIVLCLIAAWCGSTDEITRVAVEETLKDYRSDFAGESTATVNMGLKYICQRLSLLELSE